MSSSVTVVTTRIADVRALFGYYLDSGKRLFTTYDIPEESFLFDLEHDPLAQKNLITEEQTLRLNQKVLSDLKRIEEMYGKAGQSVVSKK